MKVLVTGGSGFIGSHLIPNLMRSGIDACNFDIRTSQIPSSFMQKAVEDLQPHDISGHDAIINLAAQSNVAMGMRSPLHTLNNNTTSTLHLLELLRRMPKDSRPSKVIFMSTQNVYGIPEVAPVPEGYKLNPVEPYAASKAMMEMLVNAWSKEYDLPCIILRLATVFGYGGNAVANNFLDTVKRGKPIEIHGDGSQERDLNYVDNVIHALHLVLKSDYRNGIWNIGSGKVTSLKDLSNLVLKVSGSEQSVVYTPKVRKFDGKLFLDISKARRQLGYVPTISLERGLELTWNQMRSQV